MSWQRVVDGLIPRLVDEETVVELTAAEQIRAIWDEKRQAYRLVIGDEGVGALVPTREGWETAWCHVIATRSRDGVRLALRHEPPPADPVMSRALRAALREDILAPWRGDDPPPTCH